MALFSANLYYRTETTNNVWNKVCFMPFDDFEKKKKSKAWGRRFKKVSYDLCRFADCSVCGQFSLRRWVWRKSCVNVLNMNDDKGSRSQYCRFLSRIRSIRPPKCCLLCNRWERSTAPQESTILHIVVFFCFKHALFNCIYRNVLRVCQWSPSFCVRRFEVSAFQMLL